MLQLLIILATLLILAVVVEVCNNPVVEVCNNPVVEVPKMRVVATGLGARQRTIVEFCYGINLVYNCNSVDTLVLDGWLLNNNHYARALYHNGYIHLDVEFSKLPKHVRDIFQEVASHRLIEPSKWDYVDGVVVYK